MTANARLLRNAATSGSAPCGHVTATCGLASRGNFRLGALSSTSPAARPSCIHDVSIPSCGHPSGGVAKGTQLLSYTGNGSHKMWISRVKKTILVAIGVIFATILSIWLVIEKPGMASKEERAVLHAHLKNLDWKSNCYSLMTSHLTIGGGSSYWFGSDYYSVENVTLRTAHQLSKRRDRALSIWTWSDLSLMGSIAAPWDRLGCTKITQIGTPQFWGDYAFVDEVAGRFHSTAAYKRGPRGWQRVASTMNLWGSPVY